MLPDIDSLALFVRAAELRSLTKAAEASHIGLAAASRRMALLEHRFRTTLLERSSRGVEMTAAGHPCCRMHALCWSNSTRCRLKCVTMPTAAKAPCACWPILR